MDHIETELKLFPPDFAALRTQIRHHGGQYKSKRIFEANIRYETFDDRLIKNNCLLRLRQDRKATLTFKSPPAQSNQRFKSCREREVQVSDFDTMDAILQALGFQRRQVYEKWRETWHRMAPNSA